MRKTVPMADIFRDKTFWGPSVQANMLRAWVDDEYKTVPMADISRDKTFRGQADMLRALVDDRR
jgi:hypothetical protein